ncbi:hypothetical protein GRI99_17760 [Altererythrobacter buctensis]|uniref:Uncharacterized protein n=1 Tax=Alteraurantiacibacter buctensis TaxID=1503981 RepID=A0A844Z4C0_9SPHN|nr:hypothetical protein [Alteraurantiacibacter buctensis]
MSIGPPCGKRAAPLQVHPASGVRTIATLPRLHPQLVIALLAAAVALGAGLLLLALHNADWRGDEYTYHA